MNKNFVESFVRECYNQGLTEKQACVALEITMQKSAAGTRTEYGDAYGDLDHLGERLAGVEITRGEPTYAEQPQWTNINDWPGLIWDGAQRYILGPAANWLIPGIYREEAKVHDPYTSINYASNYAKGFRRNWDAAQDVAAAQLARLRDEYGVDDPRYKEFDSARATMEYMYDPIRNRRKYHIEEYTKARGILEERLARAEEAGNTARAASIKGQIVELEKQHALNMADSDREDANFRAMVVGTSGANGQAASTQHGVAATLGQQMEENQLDLDRINADLAYANSGFFNRWINPATADWGRAIATMDTSQLQKDRQHLITRNIDLQQREDEIAAMQKEVRRRGWTPELADAVMKGEPSPSKKEAESSEVHKAKRDAGRAMFDFAAPNLPAKAKSPITNASMAKVHEIVNAPKPTKLAAPADKVSPVAKAALDANAALAAKVSPVAKAALDALATPAPAKKPVVAPKLKKKEPLPVA